MDEFTVERVLTVVDLVPPGHVIAYGQIGRIVGLSARQVGRVMFEHGQDVNWWRVTTSYGDLPPELRSRAEAHWRAEGMVMKPNGLGVRIADYQVDLAELEVAYRARIAKLVKDVGTPLPKTSRPATAALGVIGITTLEALSLHSEQEIAKLHGMGPKALRMLREELHHHGLRFASAPHA